MAKRMTETNKWKDNWFSNLSNDQKLIWLFILDDCTHAGIWEKNFRRLRFETNTDLSDEDISNFLYSKVIDLGDKYFIPKFLDFQYNNFLTSQSPAIKSARESLIKIGLLSKDLVWIKEALYNPNETLNKGYDKGYTNPSIIPNKGLDKGLLRAKDKDKAEETDMDKVKDKSKDKETDKAEVKFKETEKEQYYTAKTYLQNPNYSSEHDPNAFDDMIDEYILRKQK